MSWPKTVSRHTRSSLGGFPAILAAGLLMTGLALHPRILALFRGGHLPSPDLARFLPLASCCVCAAGILMAFAGVLLRRYRPSWYSRLNGWIVNLFLVTASTVLILFVAELLLSWLDPFGARQLRAANRYFFEAVVKSEVPGIRYENKPFYEGDIAGIPVKINARGLRDDDYPYEKLAGVFRILCLGDSVTFGWGVPLPQTFPKRLEVLLNQSDLFGPVQVINAGVGGYTTIQESAFLKKEGLKYDPDAVVLLFTVNDASEPVRIFEPGAPEKAVEKGRFPLTNAVAQKLVPSLYTLIKYLTLPDQDYRKDFTDTEGSGWHRCREALQEMARNLQDRGASLRIFLLPALQDLEKDYPYTVVHRELARFCMESRIPFVDLYSVFQNLPARKVRNSLIDGHPNAYAHLLIAEAIFRNLAEQKKNFTPSPPEDQRPG